MNGVEEDIVFRVYFPANLLPSTVRLTSCTLVVTEDVGSNSEKQRNKYAHDKGIIYNTVVRQRQQSSFTKADAASNMTIDLTGINGNSAGMIVYAASPSLPGTSSVQDPFSASGTTVVANTLLAKRFPLTTLELNDQMGKKRTEQLKGSAVLSFTWWNHVGTSFPARSYGNTYLIPFASHFRSSVVEGNNYGHLKTDGTDRLILTAPWAYTARSSGTETWVITITNYVYHQLVFQNGKLLNIIKK